ncbi:MAG: phospholipid/cholesterol/gamma-HCH transport system substrate-binding protein [Pseudonocardiales bacterium]|nr:phospholipid/cholesterol/gamma-HCH transport system substrate-binding protein [Pseudonocardiales bacterium]
MARESIGTILRRRLLGLGFIALIFALVGLSIAFYNKAFTKVVLVTLKTDHTGNQLLTQSDVKERGIIVGSVRKVKVDSQGGCADPTGTCTSITLALDPSRVKLIPGNVSAQILPKTLFGEQYVSLTLPKDPGPAIRGGAVIGQDRSSVALETQKVLGDFLPLLDAVQPAELNATLTAMATALKGRGEQLGKTLVAMDSYLKQLNAIASPGKTYVSMMVDDLKKLGDVSEEFNNVAPDLVGMLNNMQTSARTVINKQAALDSILTTANSTSNIISSFLNDNEQRLITVVQTSAKVYSLLNAYTPEYSCMLTALNELGTRAKAGIRNNQIQLSAQLFVANSKDGAYFPGNEPKYVTGLGPNCFGMPNPQVPFKSPSNFRCVNDGAAFTEDACAQAATTSGFDQQSVGSAPETAMINTLIAGSYGTTPDKVPPVATMLAAPALRGSEVTTK